MKSLDKPVTVQEAKEAAKSYQEQVILLQAAVKSFEDKTRNTFPTLSKFGEQIEGKQGNFNMLELQSASRWLITDSERLKINVDGARNDTEEVLEYSEKFTKALETISKDPIASKEIEGSEGRRILSGKTGEQTPIMRSPSVKDKTRLYNKLDEAVTPSVLPARLSDKVTNQGSVGSMVSRINKDNEAKGTANHPLTPRGTSGDTTNFTLTAPKRTIERRNYGTPPVSPSRFNNKTEGYTREVSVKSRAAMFSQKDSNTGGDVNNRQPLKRTPTAIIKNNVVSQSGNSQLR